MIKELTVAECDVCGMTVRAKEEPGQYNETGYTLPDGWQWSPVNKGVCICRLCLEKLKNKTFNCTLREAGK